MSFSFGDNKNIFNPGDYKDIFPLAAMQFFDTAFFTFVMFFWDILLISPSSLQIMEFPGCLLFEYWPSPTLFSLCKLSQGWLHTATYCEFITLHSYLIKMCQVRVLLVLEGGFSRNFILEKSKMFHFIPIFLSSWKIHRNIRTQKCNYSGHEIHI